MLNRSWAGAATGAAALALVAALSGCGSSTPGTPAAGSGTAAHGSAKDSPPALSAGGPDIHVIDLADSFSPDTLQISVGMQFVIDVASNVRASGLTGATCTAGKSQPLPGGMLTVRCQNSSSYEYTATHAGTVTLSATVKPHCTGGTMCPQWVKESHLRVTIASS